MNIFKVVIKIFLALILPIVSYFTISYIIQLFPTSDKCQKGEDYFYIYHSDVHTEIIFEIKRDKKLFLEKFPNLLRGQTRGYLAFSYGDKDFMMKVPDWDHIKPKIAIKALFVNTQALLRVGHYHGIYLDKVTKLKISHKCKERLLNIIFDNFISKDNRFVRFRDNLGDKTTFYFLAKKPYNLWNTCNSWSGNVLRESGISMGYWTPLASQVGYHLKGK